MRQKNVPPNTVSSRSLGPEPCTSTTAAVGVFVPVAAPFFLLALFPSYLKRLPKSGGWMARVKILLGFLVLAIREADRLRTLVERMLGPRGESNKQSLNIHDVLEHVRQVGGGIGGHDQCAPAALGRAQLKAARGSLWRAGLDIAACSELLGTQRGHDARLHRQDGGAGDGA